MNRPYTIDHNDIGLDRVVINRTLRNTYFLLAISLIPTVLGAWLGVATQVIFRIPSLVYVLLFFVGSFGLMSLVQRNRNSSAGVVYLLAFTFFMGIALSGILTVALSIPNGVGLVMYALGGTATVFAAMSVLAFNVQRDLSFMYKGLIIGVVVIIFASLANIFFVIPALQLAISTIAMVVFSLFLLIDLQRVVQQGETNYISATLAIYLDLYNLFVNLLNILLLVAGRRD